MRRLNRANRISRQNAGRELKKPRKLTARDRILLKSAEKLINVHAKLFELLASE